ncbi:hypothetical protein BASA83_001494 [Batrachochytrium salamandrivorans]|nr:hypothetical protein BASA83_001494 [Batrachochytrium salamandrivorans]
MTQHTISNTIHNNLNTVDLGNDTIDYPPLSSSAAAAAVAANAIRAMSPGAAFDYSNINNADRMDSNPVDYSYSVNPLPISDPSRIKDNYYYEEDPHSNTNDYQQQQQQQHLVMDGTRDFVTIGSTTTTTPPPLPHSLLPASTASRHHQFAMVFGAGLETGPDKGGIEGVGLVKSPPLPPFSSSTTAVHPIHMGALVNTASIHRRRRRRPFLLVQLQLQQH